MTAKSKDTKGKSAARAAQQRIFLVVVDETEEMRVALRYAALRARHTGGRVALLFVIEPSELKTWGAIEDLQRHVFSVKDLDNRTEVCNRTRQSIQPRGHECVAFPYEFQRCL